MHLWSVASLVALALAQALPAQAQDEPAPRKETVRAFSLQVTGDGHVALSVKDKNGDKTYKADSMKEFVEKYPNVARDYGVGRSESGDFHMPKALAKSFEEWRKQFGDTDAWKGDPELRKFLENPERMFQDFHAQRDVEGGKAANPHRLGLRLAPLSQTLADQAGIDVSKGALIAEVESGSLAEKSGLQKHDILVKVDGKDVAGTESVRATVQDALKKKDFEVDVIRQGKKQTVKVQPPSEK